MTARPENDWAHPDWSGRTVVLLGGGPSLNRLDGGLLQGKTVVAINEAGLSFWPTADILFWSDVRWVDWNFDRMKLHKGPMRYTCQTYRVREIPRARLLKHRPKDGDGHWLPVCRDPREVAGHDSGTKALNLVLHTGAARVVLLGFDMRDYSMDAWQLGSFHDKHQLPPLENQRALFRKAHERMAAALPDGFEVINATPGTALHAYPLARPEDVL